MYCFIMIKSKTGTGKNCAVVGCTNNSKKLRKWKLLVCEIHSPLTHDECEEDLIELTRSMQHTVSNCTTSVLNFLAYIFARCAFACAAMQCKLASCSQTPPSYGVTL